MSTRTAESSVLGVDGIRGGWVGALLTGSDEVEWLVVDHVGQLMATLEPALVATIAIDIPIGLSEGPPRRCDTEARSRLGRRGSSVFPAPTRPSVRDWVGGATYAQAVSCAHARGHAAPSLQTWNILGKVAEVDAWLTPGRHARVVECHPEVSLRALDGRVSAPKRTPDGRAQRRDALRGWVDVEHALRALPRGVPETDALDALACAWTAQRVQRGAAEVLGDPQARDSLGLEMLIRW